MITELSIGDTVLTTSKWHLTDMQAGYPNINHTVINRGNWNGARIYPGKFGGFQIISEWTVVGDTFSDLADQREDFRKAVSICLSQGEQEMTITKSNGIVLTLPIKAVKVSSQIKSADGNSGSFLATFYSERPFLQNHDQTVEVLSIFSGGGMAIPMAIPMSMAEGGSNIFEVTNNGEFNAYPILTFTGALDFPTVTNVTTGEQISINYMLDTDEDIIEVDTYERSAILLPSANNARQYVTGDFITLQPGTNELRLGAGSYNEQGTVTVSFYDTYLGV